jgi:hypothetical protein
VNYPGDYPPYGDVNLGEVVDYINLWTEGESELSDVINLINAWDGGLCGLRGIHENTP